MILGPAMQKMGEPDMVSGRSRRDVGGGSGAINADAINKMVVMETAQGKYVDIGRVISYAGSPSVEVEKSTGTRISWNASLCRLATDDEVARYWRQRAITAERKLEDG